MVQVLQICVALPRAIARQSSTSAVRAVKDGREPSVMGGGSLRHLLEH